MTQWPETLPVSPLLDGFTETTPDTVIRSDMDAGPAKIRPRTTAGTRNLTMRFIMTKNQTALFDSFYLQDIHGGATPFDFMHPRTGETLNLRIIKPPVYSPVNGRHFKIEIEAEALP